MFEDITKNKSYLHSKILSLKNTADKEKLFYEIDNEIVKIKQEINCCYDNMGIISDVINSAELINHAGGNLISGNVNIKKNNLRNKSKKLQKIFSLYYLDKGNYFQKHGRFNLALDAWEEILKIDPDNEFIHLKLQKPTIGQNNDLKNRSKYLTNRYRFKYIRSFGKDIIKKPVYMCASETKNTMFVSDYERHKIHKFTTDGEYLGAIPVNIKKPIGLFLEEENTLWVCDFGNGRLLSTDFNGKVLEEININKLLNETNESMKPSVGCINGDQIYLSLTNEKFKISKVISFNKNSPITSVENISSDNFQLITEMKIINNVLYAANLEPGRLFEFNATQRKFVQLANMRSIGKVFRFTEVNDVLFVSTGKYISKMNSNGELIFSADLEGIVNGSSQLTGLIVIENKKKKTLFVADNIQNSIHMFSI